MQILYSMKQRVISPASKNVLKHFKCHQLLFVNKTCIYKQLLDYYIYTNNTFCISEYLFYMNMKLYDRAQQFTAWIFRYNNLPREYFDTRGILYLLITNQCLKATKSYTNTRQVRSWQTSQSSIMLLEEKNIFFKWYYDQNF